MARQINRNRKSSEARAVKKPNFGEVLRQTRKKHGISLAEVSTDLRVREDILVAIEQGDFSRIPPQGYSRNMIKSYARLLGLDAKKITDMFLDAEYSYQLGEKQADAQRISDENKKRVPARPIRKSTGAMTPREQIEKRRKELEGQDKETERLGSGAIKGRTIHVYGRRYKNTPRARRELDAEDNLHRGRSAIRESSITNKDLMDGGSYKQARERLEKRQRRKLSRQDSSELNENENPNAINTAQKKSGYQFMNIYQKKNTAGQSRLTVPVIAVSVVVLLIVLIMVFFFLGKQQENDKTDVSKLNVVGISDIENAGKQNENTHENDSSGTPVLAAEEPKEVEFKYKVKDGQSVYMEIYENNSTRPILAREVKSGETNIFKVTGTLKVVTTHPDAVELYVANELVTPVDEKGQGVYTYTVDFNQYLTQWKAKNAAKKPGN